MPIISVTALKNIPGNRYGITGKGGLDQLVTAGQGCRNINSPKQRGDREIDNPKQGDDRKIDNPK